MPDTTHLHQLLFFLLSKKIDLSKSILNSITGVSINLYNAIIIYFAAMNINNKKIQITFFIFKFNCLYNFIFFIKEI